MQKKKNIMRLFQLLLLWSPLVVENVDCFSQLNSLKFSSSPMTISQSYHKQQQISSLSLSLNDNNRYNQQRSTVRRTTQQQQRHRPYVGIGANNKNNRFHSKMRSSNSNEIATDKLDDDNDKTLFESFGKGMKRDFTKRLPLYKSDIIDGLNTQCLATILYLFFACLAPAIGFGNICSLATSGDIGTIEMIISTSICGVLYALLAPQPMQLIGPMGPNLAFTVSLVTFAKLLGKPFLSIYAWTGVWTSAILMISSLFSVSNIVQYLTRFTDEIFSVLISTIFLFEAITNVLNAFTLPISTATKSLLTLTCASITFGIGMTLKSLKTCKYFTKSIRDNLSNFAPAIGVVFGSLFAKFIQIKYTVAGSGAAASAAAAAVTLPSLTLPTKFVTTSGRPWLIINRMFNNDIIPLWTRFVCIIPAILASILLFLDQNITARLVNNPRYKMKKGRKLGNVIDGMHGDMFVLSLLTFITSIFGLPWMAGATTRSAAHVRSLSIYDNDGNIIGTKENRITGSIIHALIGACVLFKLPRTILSQVPLPVLSGVFMYLGFTSLQGLELWDRIKGLFEDTSVAPKDKKWSTIVPCNKTTLYTLIQILCVGLLMIVTKSSYGVISPLIVALLPLLRYGLIKSNIITKDEMNVLDN